MTQNTLSKSVLYYLEENWGQKVTEYCAMGDLVENPAMILGAKYLGVFSSRSLKTGEKYISFAQFVHFLREVCLLFNFGVMKFTIMSRKT